MSGHIFPHLAPAASCFHFAGDTYRTRKQFKCHIAIFGCFTEPNLDFRCCSENVAHDCDLSTPLGNIALVDANCIIPPERKQQVTTAGRSSGPPRLTPVLTHNHHYFTSAHLSCTHIVTFDEKDRGCQGTSSSKVKTSSILRRQL